MKKFAYELLATKNDTVYVDMTDDKTTAVTKMNGAAQKGYSVLLMGQKDGKRCGVTVGPKTDWSKFTKVVEVTFGHHSQRFTYLCKNHWEAGDGMILRTPHGDSMAIVVSDARYVTLAEVQAIENNIGYSLKVIEEAIVK